MKFRMLTLDPVARIALGLVALLLSLLLVLDLVFGLIPDRADFARQLRQRTSESLAVQAAALLQEGDMATLQRILQQVRERTTDLRSVAVRHQSGAIAA